MQVYNMYRNDSNIMGINSGPLNSINESKIYICIFSTSK